MDENEDEAENPLNHGNIIIKSNKKFIKYVIHHKHSMTSEHLKQKPFKEIFNIQHEELDTEEGSQMNRKRNPLHHQKSQNKNVSLKHLVKMNKRQIYLKHFKFTTSGMSLITNIL